MTRFRAAVVQAAPVSGNTSATIDKTIGLIREAAALGANIVVFPEAFIGGYPKGVNFNIYVGARTPEGRQEFADYYAGAIVVPGPETANLAEAVREARLFLTIGVIERDGGTLYCTPDCAVAAYERAGIHLCQKQDHPRPERLKKSFGTAQLDISLRRSDNVAVF